MDDVWFDLSQNAIRFATQIERINVAQRLVTWESMALQTVNNDRSAVMVLAEIAKDLGSGRRDHVDFDVSASQACGETLGESCGSVYVGREGVGAD